MYHVSDEGRVSLESPFLIHLFVGCEFARSRKVECVETMVRCLVCEIPFLHTGSVVVSAIKRVHQVTRDSIQA